MNRLVVKFKAPEHVWSVARLISQPTPVQAATQSDPFPCWWRVILKADNFQSKTVKKNVENNRTIQNYYVHTLVAVSPFLGGRDWLICALSICSCLPVLLHIGQSTPPPHNDNNDDEVNDDEVNDYNDDVDDDDYC